MYVQCRQFCQERDGLWRPDDSPISQNTLGTGLLDNQPATKSVEWHVREKPSSKEDKPRTELLMTNRVMQGKQQQRKPIKSGGDQTRVLKVGKGLLGFRKLVKAEKQEGIEYFFPKNCTQAQLVDL